MKIETAHALAHYVEWQHAKDRARLSRVRGKDPKDEFDALAATELGDLIHRIASGERPR